MFDTRKLGVWAAAAAVAAGGPAAADTVTLANGDVLSGRLIAVDDTDVRLETEALGKVTLPRARVASIFLGDRKPAVAAPPAAGPGELTDVLKQLQAAAPSGRQMDDLQKLFPELANPAVAKQFEGLVGGLRRGDLSVQDVRKQAVAARRQVTDATKDLGPDVEQALAPYLSILDKFIRDTEPKAADKPADRK